MGLMPKILNLQHRVSAFSKFFEDENNQGDEAKNWHSTFVQQVYDPKLLFAHSRDELKLIHDDFQLEDGCAGARSFLDQHQRDILSSQAIVKPQRQLVRTSYLDFRSCFAQLSCDAYINSSNITAQTHLSLFGLADIV